MNYTYQCDTVGILPAVYVFTGNDSYACVQSELDRAQSADSWYTVLTAAMLLRVCGHPENTLPSLVLHRLHCSRSRLL